MQSVSLMLSSYLNWTNLLTVSSVIPHPLQNKTNSSICLITPDPQRLYKDTIAHPSFPNPQIRDKISRVIGLSKLKANYKSFESRRQLFAEHDIFLADSRVIVSLPSVLGKVFFKGGSKRPIPIDIAGPRARGEDGKRLKAAPQSVRKAPPDAIGQGAASPATVAKEIESCLSAALVHLSPGVSTAVKVARGDFSPEMCFQNMEAVLRLMTERLIPKGWNNIRAIHIKGPTTASFPIWLASQLWVDDEDILEEKKIQGKNRNQDSSQRSRDDNAVPSDASGKRKARSRDITDVSQPRSKKKKSEAEMKPAQEQAGRKRFLKNQKSEAMSGLSGALTQD